MTQPKMKKHPNLKHPDAVFHKNANPEVKHHNTAFHNNDNPGIFINRVK